MNVTVAWLAPLAVAVPLAGGALAAISGKRAPRVVPTSIALAAMLFSAIACTVLASQAAAHGTIVHWFGGWTPRHGVALGIAFVVDPGGAAFAALAGWLNVAALVFVWTYYQEDEAFAALLQVFGAALAGFFLTGDLFNLFVFFELMSVSAYALTAYRSEDRSAVLGAFAFAVVNSTGAFFTLTGIALVYARTGALAFAQIAHALDGRHDPLVVVAFALIVLGFMVKAAIVPFHFWLGDAHAVAPTPVCVLFSGIMVQAGLFAVARVYWDVFSGALGPQAAQIRDVLLTFGLVTAIVGAAMAYAQRHLKRLLAFSTVAHSGVMLCAVALFDPLGVAGFFAYALGHGLIKGSLFLASGIVLNRFQTLDVEALRGKLSTLPWLPAIFAIGALGLAGVPPFSTFTGKALFDRALGNAHLDWIGIVLALATAVTGAAVLNAAGRMTFGWGPAPDPCSVTPSHEEPETPPARGLELAVMSAPALALLVAALASGTVPGLVPATLSAAARFVDRLGFESVVLDSTPSLPLHAPLTASVGAAAGPALAAGLAAILIAALGLFGHRVRPLWSRLAKAYDTVMALPHAWHSGLITDYIAWLVTGAALLAAALVIVVR